MLSLMHTDVALLGFQLGASQLNTFETFLNSAVSGIQNAGVITGMLKVSYVIMLVGFLWEMYQSAAGGGDVRALGRSLAKYTATALVVQAWPEVFVAINSGFVNAGAWMTNQGGVGNVLDTWMQQLNAQFTTQGYAHFWGLITGEITGLLDAILIFIAYLLYPIVTVIFGFFYLLLGSILFVTGPIVIAFLPLGATNRIAKSYIENLLIWNSWPILYGALGLLITAVHLGDMQQTLFNQNFLGEFAGLEGSVLVGLISIVYSVAIGVIPFMAKAIVQGEAGAAVGQMMSAATTAISAGTAAVAGAAAGAAAAAPAAQGGSQAAGAASGAGAGGNSISATSGNQPAPAQPMPAPSSASPSSSSSQSAGNSPASPSSGGDPSGAASAAGEFAAANEVAGGGVAPATGGDSAGSGGDSTSSSAGTEDSAEVSAISDSGGGSDPASSDGSTGATDSGGPQSEGVQKAINNMDGSRKDAGVLKGIQEDKKPSTPATAQSPGDTGGSSNSGAGSPGGSDSTPASGSDSSGSSAPSGAKAAGKPDSSAKPASTSPSAGGKQSGGTPSSGGARGSAPHAPQPRHGLATWGAYHVARMAAQGAVSSANSVQRGVGAVTSAAANPGEAGKSVGAAVGSAVGGVVNGVHKGVAGAGQVAAAISSPGKTAGNAVQSVRDAVASGAGEVSQAAKGVKDGFSEAYAKKTAPAGDETK